MDSGSVSYYQSSRNRGLINFIALTVFLSLVAYFAEYETRLSLLKEASLLAQVIVFSVLIIILLIIVYLIVISIRDIILNDRFGLQLHENYLIFTEPNNWMNKSYKLEYSDITEIHKEYDSEGNEYYLRSKDGKRYEFPNLNENSAEEALDKLAKHLEHVKVVVVNKPNT
jgi:hypothetical protein